MENAGKPVKSEVFFYKQDKNAMHYILVKKIPIKLKKLHALQNSQKKLKWHL